MSYLVRTFCKSTSRENEFKCIGTYGSIDQAIEAARQTIDRSLLRLFAPDTSNYALFHQYEAFGDIPCIFQAGDHSPGAVAFNPLEYAIARSAVICADPGDQRDEDRKFWSSTRVHDSPSRRASPPAMVTQTV